MSADYRDWSKYIAIYTSRFVLLSVWNERDIVSVIVVVSTIAIIYIIIIGEQA